MIALFKLVMSNQTMSANDHIKMEDLQPRREAYQGGGDFHFNMIKIGRAHV